MLVTRYLFKNLLHAAVFVALTLTLVIWLTQALKLLELVANSDAPPAVFLQLVALTLPKFLEIILPLALVVAVLFTYNKFIMDNELIVLRACGVDQYTLARPAVLLALATSLLLTLITTWISPKCYEQAQELRQAIKTQYSAFLLREGVFNTFGSALTVYLRAREDNGDMAGLMIYDTRDKKSPPVTITAKKGRIVMDGDTPSIMVFDGLRQQPDPRSGALSKLYFSRYTIEIKGLGDTMQERWRGAGERTLPELLNADPANRRDMESRGLFLAEANHRLVSPWNALSFTMIALAVLLLGPFNRRGHGTKILAAGLLVVLAQTLSLFLVNLSKKHPALIPLVDLNTLAPVALGFYLLHIRGEQKLMALARWWHARRLPPQERPA